MSSLKPRITVGKLPNCSVDDVIEFLLSLDLTKYYLVVEQGSNPPESVHVQGWIVTEHKKDYISKQMLKFVMKYVPDPRSEKGKPNAYYACPKVKEKDGEIPFSYISYCMKEDKKPIHNLTSDELIDALEYQEQYEMDKKKKKEDKKLTAFQKLEKAFINSDCPRTIQCIADWVVRYYKDNEKIVMEGHMKNQVQTLALKYDKSYETELSSKLLRMCVSYEFMQTNLMK